MRTARLVLTLLAFAFAANALAGGRAACRLELPPALVCYLEQVAFSSGALELGGGGELRLRQGQAVALTPYSYAAWYEEAWFLVAEARAPLLFSGVRPDAGFKLALSVGLRW